MVDVLLAFLLSLTALDKLATAQLTILMFMPNFVLIEGRIKFSQAIIDT